MSKIPWKIISICLISVSVILTGGTAYVASDVLGYLQWIFYGAGMLAIAALFCLKQEPEKSEVSLETELETREKALKEAEKRFHKKQNEFTQKLMANYEWLEFPTEDDKETLYSSDSDTEMFRDQEVLALLEKKTRLLFEKIRTNRYYEAGMFQNTLILNDLVELIESVAKIYKPDSENPLLETSIEYLLRSVNRISLQLLILLEQLPMNLKEYNLKKTYENIQAGVKVYELYKAAKPYLPLVRPVYYAGRFALGTTPLTLGAGWAVGEIFTRGTRKLSTHLANQYALNLLQDMVFIIGNEAAGIFGGDYRHREIHWIYGAELTDLISQFSVSREMLLHALNEIGGLRLRSEYDRIFLYRCLASHKSASPERFEAQTCLSPAERQTIARRLEHFAKHYIHGNPKDLLAWKLKAEDRLGIKLQMDTVKNSQLSVQVSDLKGKLFQVSDLKHAIRSLAGFLLEVKNKNPEDLPALLAETCLLKNADENLKQEILTEIQAFPPMMFDYPDLEPSDKLLDNYLKALTRLSVRVFPHNGAGDLLVEDAAHYFRKNFRSLKKEMDQLYVDFLAENLNSASPEKRIKPHIAREILFYMEPEESPLFLYTDITMENHLFEKLRSPLKKELWLIGTSLQRLLLLGVNSLEKNETDESSILMWTGGTSGENPISLERVRQRLCDDCRIKGGIWYWEVAKELETFPMIRLSGQTIGRYEVYFTALCSS